MAATAAFRFAPAVNHRSKLLANSQCCLTRTSFPIVALQFCQPAARQPLPSLASLYRRGPLTVIARADKNEALEGGSLDSREQEYEEARGQSTLPERFRNLTKEVPESPTRWPWLIALAFLVYAWRTVLWELSNWKKAVTAIVSFMGYIGKFILAFVFHFIGDPVTAIIQCIEFSIYSIRSVYFSVVGFAPVRELSTILLLTSTMLAIAEAASPNSVNDQQNLLVVAGLVAFGAVRGYLPEALFWLSLVGLFGYSRFINKRDGVSASLPSVFVLTAVGEPWLRALSLSAYLAFSIFQYSKAIQNHKTDDKISGRSSRPPMPLVLAALAIGINLAAVWIRHRHLTWMIV